MLIFHDQQLSPLPAPSRAKIERMDADRDGLHAVVRQTSDLVQEARQEHGLLLARARHHHAVSTPGGHNLDADFAAAAGKVPDAGPPPVGAFRRAMEEGRSDRQEQAERLMEPVQRAKRQLEAATAAHDRAVQLWQAYSFLEPARQWLARIAGSGVQLRHAPLAAPKVKSFPDEVARLRAELAAMDQAWRTAESAPSLPDDYRQRAIDEVEALAARGAPTVDLRSRGPNPLGLAGLFASQLTTFRGAKPEDTIHRLIGDPSAFQVWLHRDAILARINQLIDRAPADGALSYDAREKRFAEISASRLKLEFEEESAIVAAANAGMNIPRRRDADPRAVLEVSEQ